MANRFKVNEKVWVPARRVGDRGNYALVERQVREATNLSVMVESTDGTWVRIGTRQVHSDDLGFLAIRVGDWYTEATLLDPLAKSVLHNLRLLVPDERVRLVNVRTTSEIEHAVAQVGAAFSYLVIIGHGSKDGRLETVDGGMTPMDLAASATAGVPKNVISLACYSGQVAFARPFSAGTAVRNFVAPFGALHGAAGSTFLQTFLHDHLLLGTGIQAAFRRTNAVIEGTHFVLWRNGGRRV